MDPTRFDAFTRFFATRRLSRRQTLAAGGAGLAAGLLATNRTPAFAQDATPPATPAIDLNDPHPSADTAGTHPEFLFVQPFDGGAWEPKPSEDGTYILTLSGAAANTTYFSDRPERITGLAPTQQFLDGLGFTSENPPNAALVVQTGQGEQDILIVVLINPIYDASAGTLVYDARVLADYGERGLAHLAQAQTDYELPASFGEGSLFIDDCPNSTDQCWQECNMVGTIQSGNCWDSSTWTCNPCGSYQAQCISTFPACYPSTGNCCKDDIDICGEPGCGNQSNCGGC